MGDKATIEELAKRVADLQREITYVRSSLKDIQEFCVAKQELPFKIKERVDFLLGLRKVEQQKFIEESIASMINDKMLQAKANVHYNSVFEQRQQALESKFTWRFTLLGCGLVANCVYSILLKQ